MTGEVQVGRRQQHELFPLVAGSVTDCQEACGKRGLKFLDARRVGSVAPRVPGEVQLPEYVAIHDGEDGEERRLRAGMPRGLQYREVRDFHWVVKAMVLP